MVGWGTGAGGRGPSLSQRERQREREREQGRTEDNTRNPFVPNLRMTLEPSSILCSSRMRRYTPRQSALPCPCPAPSAHHFLELPLLPLACRFPRPAASPRSRTCTPRPPPPANLDKCEVSPIKTDPATKPVPMKGSPVKVKYTYFFCSESMRAYRIQEGFSGSGG